MPLLVRFCSSFKISLGQPGGGAATRQARQPELHRHRRSRRGRPRYRGRGFRETRSGAERAFDLQRCRRWSSSFGDATFNPPGRSTRETVDVAGLFARDAASTLRWSRTTTTSCACVSRYAHLSFEPASACRSGSAGTRRTARSSCNAAAARPSSFKIIEGHLQDLNETTLLKLRSC